MGMKNFVSFFKNFEGYIFQFCFFLRQSVEQIGNRADRMMIATEELFLYSSTDIEVCDFIHVYLVKDQSVSYLLTVL